MFRLIVASSNVLIRLDGKRDFVTFVAQKRDDGIVADTDLFAGA